MGKRCDFCDTITDIHGSGVMDTRRCPVCRATYVEFHIDKGPDPDHLRHRAEELNELADLFEKHGRINPIQALITKAARRREK